MSTTRKRASASATHPCARAVARLVTGRADELVVVLVGLVVVGDVARVAQGAGVALVAGACPVTLSRAIALSTEKINDEREFSPR